MTYVMNDENAARMKSINVETIPVSVSHTNYHELIMVRPHNTISNVGNSYPVQFFPRLCLLFTCLLLATSASSTKFLNVSHDIDYIDGNLKQLFVDKTKLWYLSCKNDEWSRKSCILGYNENVLNANSVIKNCIQNNFSSDKGRKFGSFVNISPWGTDSAIVSWSERSKRSVIFNTRVVNLTNCNSDSYEFPMGNDLFSEWFILKGEQSFVVVNSVHKERNNMYSRAFNKDDGMAALKKFDCIAQDGKLVVPSEINYDFSRVSGDFILKSDEQLDVALFCDEHIEEISHLIRNTSRRAGISTANGNLTFCQRDLFRKNVFVCTSGYFTTWTDLFFDYEPHNSVLYSASGGKYLVLTSEKLDSQDDYRPISFAFYLTAFDAKGHRQNSVEVATLEYIGNRAILHAHIYENEDQEYCVTLFDTKKLTVYANCFAKKNLFFKRD